MAKDRVQRVDSRRVRSPRINLEDYYSPSSNGRTIGFGVFNEPHANSFHRFVTA